MGNSVSSPGPKCLPRPGDQNFYQDLIEKGVYYRNKLDECMWEVSLPEKWGYLPSKSGHTYWGGTTQEGIVIDENGNHVAKVYTQCSGRDDKESAFGTISRTTGKIPVRWTIDNFGYITINQNDILLEENRKKEAEEGKKRLEREEELRQYHLQQIAQHHENVLRYKNCAELYKTKLNSLSKESADYTKLFKIYSHNLEIEFRELVKSADNLSLQHPNEMKLI